jgi:HJR/Mrr/RecB family endonuclease
MGSNGGLLREFGYEVVVTGRTRDGGIDLVAAAPDGKTVAVQVKHSKNQVGVGVLRDLIGTMYLGGFESGLIVTSSNFSSDADRTGKQAEQVDSWKIELVNGSEFLGALNLSLRKAPPSLKEIAPYLGQQSLVELMRMFV